MLTYRITSDSTVDLTPERMEELGVPFVQLHYTLEGKEYPDTMTVESANFLYDEMRAGKVAVTSQATVESFMTLWEPMLKDGQDIVYVGFSSALSGTVNSGWIAREQLLESYPERKIYIVDSLCASSGEGLLLEYAVRMQEDGLSAEECYHKLEEMKLRVHHWFTVADLVYLRRGGRVSKVSAAAAALLNIKPVLNMDHLGRLTPREKVKGRKAAIKKMFQHMCDMMDPENLFANISHADCMDDVKYLISLIREKFPKMPVRAYSVGSVIGAHAGPGTLALFFLGKKRVD